MENDACEECILLKAELALQAVELERLRAIVAATAKVPTLPSSGDQKHVGTQTEESAFGGFCGDAAQMVKEVAEEVAAQTGFVFDPGSGYYYDSGTGLYYDMGSKLYYDPRTLVFFRHNAETGENEIVSKAEYPEAEESSNASKKAKSDGAESEKSEGGGTRWPPCVRLVVESSSRVQVGSVFMVTHPGGSLGSASDCDVILEEDGVSAKHAEISYDEECNNYRIRAVGKSSLVVSGSVLGPKSSFVPIGHWSSLHIGSVQLTCHVHEGSETCNSCEPGLTLAASAASTVSGTTFVSKEDRERERRRTLKALKKKYAVKAVVPAGGVAPVISGEYRDRAEERRVTKGVDDLYAKPVQASVDQPIRQDNVGRKMMEKMGWKQGESLGATGEAGITEPIGFEGAKESGDRTGLGL